MYIEMVYQSLDDWKVPYMLDIFKNKNNMVLLS